MASYQSYRIAESISCSACKCSKDSKVKILLSCSCLDYFVNSPTQQPEPYLCKASKIAGWLYYPLDRFLGKNIKISNSMLILFSKSIGGFIPKKRNTLLILIKSICVPFLYFSPVSTEVIFVLCKFNGLSSVPACCCNFFSAIPSTF